jgi:hydrogenase maturation factor HypF (carbamoyltransferase family)
MINQQEYHAQKIKCDCCGNETLAEIRDDKIVIMDKRHGRRHIAILKIADLIAIIQKTSANPI